MLLNYHALLFLPTSDHLVECFNKAVDMKEEGVIIKVEDSHYQPNERNAGWYKLKPDVRI